MICTSAGFPAGELKLDASVELQGDEAVRRHHEDPGNQEEQQQQRHVPGRGRSTGREGQWQRGAKKHIQARGVFRQLIVVCFKYNTCI